MKTSDLLKLTVVLAALLLGNGLLRAADVLKLGHAANNHIYAQKLVNEIAASNTTLMAVGMHCVVPGTAKQVVVASTLNIIGKPSDPEDIVRGSTTISPSAKTPKIGIMMPLHDSAGKEIGSLALQFKFYTGEDQVKFFAEATEIRDRVARQIPSLTDLFTAQP